MSTMKLVIFTLLVGAIMAQDTDTDSTSAPADPSVTEAPAVDTAEEDTNSTSAPAEPPASEAPAVDTVEEDTNSTSAPADPSVTEAPAVDTVEEANWQDFNGRSFAYVPKPLMWADAQKHCVALGGSLASIDSSQEEDFAKVLVQGHRAWIGYSDAQIDGAWLWINSDNSIYTGWCSDKPDNAGGHQHCAVIHFSEDKCWDNQDCHTPYGSICTKG